MKILFLASLAALITGCGGGSTPGNAEQSVATVVNSPTPNAVVKPDPNSANFGTAKFGAAKFSK